MRDFFLLVTHEIFCQRDDIFFSLSKSWELQQNHIQAVIQIFSELSLFHGFSHVFIGGGDYPEIHLYAFGTTDMLEFLLFQRPENLRLRL